MIHMKFEIDHRAVLGKRNLRDKMCMPTHCDVLSPWVLKVILELSAAGVIKCVGHYIPIEMPRLGVIYCDIYQLTADGVWLCHAHDVWRAENV
jgi:hypothetical protein